MSEVVKLDILYYAHKTLSVYNVFYMRVKERIRDGDGVRASASVTVYSAVYSIYEYIW